MNSIHFNDVEMFLFLWAVPLLLGAYAYAAHKRQQALKRFAEEHLLNSINRSISPSKRWWKIGLISLAFCLVVVAAARPAWNPLPQILERKGRDVVFILDVSKSMLAEDLKPNRMERAKLAIMDVVEQLEGDRVGLIIFAGNAVVKCPLTLDYGFFRLILEDVSPHSVGRGGTMMGDAIRKAMDEVFRDQEKKFKDIILITDGEDHDSFPVEAAADAGERGIRIIAIGIGDEEQGKRIPISDETGHQTFLKYKGQEVWSKLDGDTLRKMVNATQGGRYLNVATGTIDLGDVYKKLVATAEKKDLESKAVKLYEEKYQIFLFGAFILMCIEILLGDRKRKMLKPTHLLILFALGMISIPTGALAASSQALVQKGNNAYQNEQYPEALEAYEKASIDKPESPIIYFNKGAVYYQQGDYQKATEFFEQAAIKSKDLKLEAKSHYNLGNTAFRESSRQRDSDLKKSLKALENSIRHYQRALQLDPSQDGASYNIEIARLTMKQVLDEIKKQQEQAEEQQEKQNEIADKLRSLIQGQENLEQKTKSLKDKKRKNTKFNGDQSKKLSKNQRNLRNKTKDLAQELESPPQKAQDHLNRSMRYQERAEKNLNEEKLSQAEMEQKNSTKEMKKALEAMNQGKGSDPAQGEQKSQEESAPKERGQDNEAEQETPEPPQQTVIPRDVDAHDIINQEVQNRENRYVSSSRNHHPVEKDW